MPKLKATVLITNSVFLMCNRITDEGGSTVELGVLPSGVFCVVMDPLPPSVNLHPHEEKIRGILNRLIYVIIHRMSVYRVF